LAVRRYEIRKPEGVENFVVDYEKELNDEQRKVVMAPPKPLLVLAGAGSGKTRVLVYRLARWLSQGLEPSHIRLLTFTNRAAKSMIERTAQLCQASAHGIMGGTFHSVALKDLQRFADRLGYTPQFTILARDDAKELMAQLRVEAQDEQLPSAELMLEMVSLSLNTQVPLGQVILERFRRFYELSDKIAQVARAFFEKKHSMNVMDFDDLLLNWYALLREHPEVLLELQREIKGVLVDEYQDTNALQAAIVHLLAGPSQNITVVGDDAQSIYAFRGATVRNILDFQQSYPDAEVLTLLTNYRSTPQILELSNASRSKAKEGFQKQLLATRGVGEKPAVVSCRDVHMQAQFVAQRIRELLDEGVMADAIAVLYRAHHHAMELQMELMRRQIPFVVRSGLRFFEQAHIKDVLSYLRYLYNPSDELSFRRAVRQHQGIGPLLSQKLWQQRAELSTVSVGPKAKVGLSCFLDLLERVKSVQSPQAMIRILLDNFYEAYAHAQFTNGQQRCDDIKQLALYAVTFVSMQKFLSELMLLSELGVEELAACALC
jgi:DNA helicase-2/ATP-dependent DNA helicase PcrA